MPTHSTAEVRRQIEEVVSPYLGARMARSSAELHCRKLGLVEESISDEEVQALVERLAVAMRVLVGKETTAEVVEQILSRLGLAEESVR